MRLLDLVERSGGTCWLCGEQVDLDAPRTGPAAPTVDALRRPGERELVAVLVDMEAATRAADWLREALTSVLGGVWDVETTPVAGAATTVSLRLAGAVERSPRPGGRRGRRRSRR